MKPAFEPQGGQRARAATPDFRCEIGRQLQLVLGLDVMLAFVTLQPALRHRTVQGNATHRAPRNTRGFDFGYVFAHQFQRIGATRELGEVVYGSHHRHHRIDIGARQRMAQIAPYLLIRKRQQHQRAKILGFNLAALLPGEVRFLVTQRAEILGAAGDQ